MKSVTPEDICRTLNEAWAADPLPIISMMRSWTVVNQKLADHPTIQTEKYRSGGTVQPVLHLLGLINGFFAYDPQTNIVMKWDDYGGFMGFRVGADSPS